MMQTRDRGAGTHNIRTATITPQDVEWKDELKWGDEFGCLTVIHHFGEPDPQSLFDPAHLFIHGEGFDV